MKYTITLYEWLNLSEKEKQELEKLKADGLISTKPLSSTVCLLEDKRDNNGKNTNWN